MTEDYHSILGVPRNASQGVIHHAYFQLAKACHPDLHPDDPDAATKFEQIQRAFEKLYKPSRWRRRRGVFTPESVLAKIASRSRPEWTCDPGSRELVIVPAIFLILLGLLGPVSVAIGTAIEKARLAERRNQPEAERVPQERESFDELFQRAGKAGSLLLSVPWTIAWGTIVVVGGINMLAMRIHMLAVAVSILVMIPCVVGPFCLLGFFVGGWALTRLYDPLTKDDFWG